jgi:alpha-L-fucosidase
MIINNRLDLGQGNNDRLILSTNAEYYTPEQHVGAYDDQRPWESCMTTSRRGQWAWGGTQDGVKSLDTCLDMLIRCAGGDGNILLNVGPTPTGEIAPEQANLLKEMGVWLAKYGESFYGTRGGPFKPGGYGVSTRKGNTVFIHVLEWVHDTVKLPAIPAKVIRSRLLGGGKVDVRQTAAGLEVAVPQPDRQTPDTIVALELDRPALELAAISVPEPLALTTRAKATASNTHQSDPQFGPDKAVDGNADTRWATDSGIRSAWLELDLGKPATFSRAVIKQAYPELKRIRKFAIEFLEGGEWKTCCKGENVGESLSIKAGPTTAQRVRLNILEATDGPTIWEFQLFE